MFSFFILYLYVIRIIYYIYYKIMFKTIKNRLKFYDNISYEIIKEMSHISKM